MAREILFRGKWFGNNEWVEGALYSYYDFKRTIVQILKDRTNGIPDAYEVYPETVGQYTGLQDKNGKRIFEGDVIQIYGAHNVVVKWKEGCFFVEDDLISVTINIYELDSLAVIGNIHDNPELLGGEG